MGIRVDGLDTLTQTIPAGALGATNGKIAFYWTPRHGHGNWEKFGNQNANMFTVYKDASNFIDCYFNTDTGARLRCLVGGVSDNPAWDTTGLSAGTKYLVEIEYNATVCTLKIDGVLKATATPLGGINYGANIPDTFYAGSTPAGVAQGDAVFS